MLAASGTTVIQCIGVAIFDPRDGTGHHVIYKWAPQRRLDALDTILRDAFDHDHILTVMVANELTIRMVEEGFVTREEAGEAWKVAHARHLWRCEREIAARNKKHRPDQTADAGSRGAAPTTGLPSAESGQGSAGIEARARWSRRARFFLRVAYTIGQGVAIGGAIAWLVHSLGLWGE